MFVVILNKSSIALIVFSIHDTWRILTHTVHASLALGVSYCIVSLWNELTELCQLFKLVWDSVRIAYFKDDPI